MIIKKTWVTLKAKKFGTMHRYHYTGWFLFGCVPLYLVRVTTS